MNGISKGVLAELERVSKFFANVEAPLMLDGAHPEPPLLARGIEDLEQIVQRGPALTPNDLVRRVEPTLLCPMHMTTAIGPEEKSMSSDCLLYFSPHILMLPRI